MKMFVLLVLALIMSTGTVFASESAPPEKIRCLIVPAYGNLDHFSTSEENARPPSKEFLRDFNDTVWASLIRELADQHCVPIALSEIDQVSTKAGIPYKDKDPKEKDESSSWSKWKDNLVQVLKPDAIVEFRLFTSRKLHGVNRSNRRVTFQRGKVACTLTFYKVAPQAGPNRTDCIGGSSPIEVLTTAQEEIDIDSPDIDNDFRGPERLVRQEMSSVTKAICSQASVISQAKLAFISPVNVGAASGQAASTGSAPATLGGNKPAPNGRVADKWALVIGISKFANSQYNLKYAAKDAQDFYNYLVTDGHFQKDHVLLLLNERATRRNIMAAFGDKFLPAVTREGDLVAIYVSTHGTPANKDPGKRNFIVAYDTESDALYETGVDMDELYRRVKEGVKTNRAFIVMDTCYSGAGVPGARGMDEYGNFDAAQVAQGFGHLVMSSSAPNERSWESKVSPNGVFTKYLLQNLRLTRGNVKNAFDKVKTDVGWEVQNAFNQPQHPQLGGEWEGTELVLSAIPSTPRAILNPDLLKLMNLQAPIQQKAPAAGASKSKRAH